MRVIAGSHRGRRLAAVPGRGVRPTADRVREALFNRLATRYGFTTPLVVDLFAGTGALGIEALSRGVGKLVSVERSARAVRVIRENLDALGLEARARVVEREVSAALAELSAAGLRAGGVFIDPPYGDGNVHATLSDPHLHRLLGEGAWVSVELAKTEDCESCYEAGPGRLVKVREDCYGDTKLLLFEAQACGASAVEEGRQ